MKLPKIECVAEEKYYKNDKFVLPSYKVKRGTFDWSDPFQMAPHLSICPNRAPWEFDEVKDFSFSPQTYGADYKHEDKEVEWLLRQINTEMKLLCEQVECFLKEYSSPDGLRCMCKDVVEGLVGCALTSYEMGKTLGTYLAITAIEFSLAYRQFIPDFFDWCYMKFSFLFKEDKQLKDFYDSLYANKQMMAETNSTTMDEKAMSHNADNLTTVALGKLAFLNGEYEGERLMSEGDFERLMRWVEVMIKDRRIEEDVEPIVLRKRKDTKRAWNKDFLKCALREVHDVVYEHKNDSWIEFMARVLGQKVNTIKSKFRDTPNDYEKVKQAVISGV